MPPIAIKSRPITADEFERYLERTIPEYADAHLRAGNVTPEESLAKAQEQFAKLLPQGLATPEMHIFMAVAADTGASVGLFWLEIKQKQGKMKGYIYDFYLDPSLQGKGLGRPLLDELERRAAALGAVEIGLHVFGDNLAARALYEKCGFRYTGMNMSKSLV